MYVFLTNLIIQFLGSGQSTFNDMLNGLPTLVFHFENAVIDLVPENKFDLKPIYDVFYDFGVCLIMLKFTIKGTTQFIMGTSGDPDSSPAHLIFGYIMALALSLTFLPLYDYIVKITKEFLNVILIHISKIDDVANFNVLFSTLSQVAGLQLLFIVIFFVYFVRLYIKFMVTGVQVYILRVGFPLACVGLMDADGGVFKQYLQKFTQILFTVIAQISLMKLGFLFLIYNHPLWGIAILKAALETPKLLQEFMFTMGGGGGGRVSGAVNTAYQGARLGKMISGMSSKF